jgi:hypothetical protein
VMLLGLACQQQQQFQLSPHTPRLVLSFASTPSFLHPHRLFLGLTATPSPARGLYAYA